MGGFEPWAFWQVSVLNYEKIWQVRQKVFSFVFLKAGNRDMSLTRDQVKGEQVLLRASGWLGYRCAYWLCVPGSDQE